jgi:phosphatidylserine decarboxylase
MKKPVSSEDSQQQTFIIAKPGYVYILGAAAVTLLFLILEMTLATLLGVAITAFICWFFRDPKRSIPDVRGGIVSPADGKVIVVGPAQDADYYDGKCQKISIFMSVFNVHVNRIPHEGRVSKIRYNPGRFFAANLDKASKENEHNAVFIETPRQEIICMVQIAGLIARRIICNIKEGDVAQRGQRFGMICFGSRVDLYLPLSVNINVSIGEHVKAGTTILGYIR